MSPIPFSPAQTLVDEPQKLKQISFTHKLVLLSLFCFASFLDSFNNSAIIPAIPAFEDSMGITQNQSTWIISAFQLTFASFLLISGRISDVYNPKTAFIIGVFFLGSISLCSGFLNNKIAIIVLRALMGITSAMSVPSALTLLVRIFSEPLQQARAIGVFGGCGALGNVLGLFIGAVLVQYASYHWIFWFVAIAAMPVALGCLLLIPTEVATTKNAFTARWKSLDLFGVSVITAALILFIYAVTSGPTDGWATAGVLTPLIISVLLTIGFFYWETWIPFENAVIPHRTWFYKNFSVLLGSALYPLLWWDAVFLVYTTLWQDGFHWSVITTAAHMLPIGVASFVISFTGALSRIFTPKWIILAGFSVAAVATLVLALGGSRPEDYWPCIFPAFILGSAGTMLAFAHANIAIFQAAPASMAGTVGAIFNGALQFGSAVGIAAFNSIQTSVQDTGVDDGKHGYRGRAAAFLFLFGVTLIEIISILYFYRDDRSRPELDDNDSAEKGRAEEKNNETDGGEGSCE